MRRSNKMHPTEEEHERRVCEELLASVRPAYAIMAVYGMVPVRFNPMRISFHPLKSTLLYALFINAVVTWSVWKLVTMRLVVLNDPSHKLDVKMLALQAIVHVCSHITVPVIWMEAAQLEKRQDLLKQFAGKRMHLLNGKFSLSTRWLHVRTWMLAIFSLVLAPMLVFAWIFKVAETGGHLTHAPAHLYQTVLVVLLVCSFSFSCLVIRDIGILFGQQFRAELSSTSMFPVKIAEYRLAFLELCSLLEELGAMTLTGLVLFLYLLLMMTFTTYQFLATLTTKSLVLSVTVGTMGLMYYLQLMLICDSAHRASEAIRTNFAIPLKSLSVWHMCEDIHKEITLFLNVVTSTPPAVSLAGFADVNRAMFGSILAAVVTYLVVLLQFRQSDETAQECNCTVT